MSRFVVALGGNAILQWGQKGTSQQQLANVVASCEQLVRLIKAGHQLLITHGNGPQVGNILIQQSAAESQVPPQSLDICGAQSQGMIGYFIQQSLQNLLQQEDMDLSVATILTQVLVDKKDPAFTNPTKPVGPFYSEEQAKQGIAAGEQWVDDAGRGWRKVVASPQPRKIVEGKIINQLMDQGVIVIASGGGGIPVYKKDGRLIGTEAVIDKDLAASVLVEEVNADGLIILTDVDYVYLNYNRENQRKLEQVTVAEAEQFISQGHFSKGSMLPKVSAAVHVAKQGKLALITSLTGVEQAIAGKSGTRITA